MRRLKTIRGDRPWACSWYVPVDVSAVQASDEYEAVFAVDETDALIAHADTIVLLGSFELLEILDL